MIECKGAVPTSVWDGEKFVKPSVAKCREGLTSYELGPSMDYRFVPVFCRSKSYYRSPLWLYSPLGRRRPAGSSPAQRSKDPTPGGMGSAQGDAIARWRSPG